MASSSAPTVGPSQADKPGMQAAQSALNRSPHHMRPKLAIARAITLLAPAGQATAYG